MELLERPRSVNASRAVLQAGSANATAELGQNAATEVRRKMQARPAELPSAISETAFIFVCSCSQLFFGSQLGDVTVLQGVLPSVIYTKTAELPWLQGAFMLGNGLAVLISGSLADLVPPKLMVNTALAWLVIWNVLGAVSIVIRSKLLFFVARAMQGCAVGVFVSTIFSMMGRIYSPGRRKNRAFSLMAATAPLGFWIGALQGGLLSKSPAWIFGSNAIASSFALAASVAYVPNFMPAAGPRSQRPSIKSFDYLGASLGLVGSGCLLFGLTQGTPTSWTPYTIATVILGIFLLVGFAYAERRVPRPLVPSFLWKTPGFGALVASYGLGYGTYAAFQFYAIRFFLTLQRASPLTAALYLTPNAVVGVLATFVVSHTFHVLPPHFLFIASMLAFAIGPVFFLPQTATTSYWALSMPGIALVTLGPDLSFAAASIFITNQVPRSYQGAAGSLLVTIQNLSSAILTAVSDAIGVKVSAGGQDGVDLQGLRAIWWFNFATALVGLGICAGFVRIPKSEERDHIDD